MSAPVGAVFYFEYKHGKSKGTTVAGSNLIQNFDRLYSSEQIHRPSWLQWTSRYLWHHSKYPSQLVPFQ
jgi:hypothetical protein